ncbi:MAG: hypothetical protein ACI9TH_001669 [Kiritimatiellia bacterium]|jgi:hypothetical protein
MYVRTVNWFRVYGLELKALGVLLILFAVVVGVRYACMTNWMASPVEAPPRVNHPN